MMVSMVLIPGTLRSMALLVSGRENNAGAGLQRRRGLMNGTELDPAADQYSL